MSRVITLGSLFDGSGGFPLAGMLNGITPVWASEIEPFAIRVTRQRFPYMRHLGDVTGINGAEIEPVDIITFGSPCQDLSIAGKQKGIYDGERSNLFFEAIRIIREMREHDRTAGRSGVNIRPRFAVWENVPGAFSSNQGRDFREVLQAFADIGEGCGAGRDNGTGSGNERRGNLDGETATAEDKKRILIPQPEKWESAGCIVGNDWSLAWRVYDAQYWPGTPQRRRRIFLIADFGGERAGEILFESESVSGDLAESGAAWQGDPADAERGAAGGCIAFKERAGRPGGGKGLLTGVDRAFTLATNNNDRVAYRNVYGIDCRNAKLDQERVHTIQAKPGSGYSLNVTPSICYPSVARSICARYDSSPCVDRGQNIIAITANGTKDNECDGHNVDIAPTIRANAATSYSSVVYENHGQDSRYTGPSDVSQTVSAHFGTGGEQHAACNRGANE